MSEKIAPPKSTKLAPARKSMAVSKAAAKKVPAAKAAAPARKLASQPASGAVKLAPAPEKKAKKAKKEGGKIKVVRDSFTMPQSDYEKIVELKQLCLKSGMHVKKSELLRAGLHALAKLNATQLKLAVTGLEKIKTGRPKKA